MELAGLAEPGDVTCALGRLRVTSRRCRSLESPQIADMAFVGSATGCSGAPACRQAAAGMFAGWGWPGVWLRGGGWLYTNMGEAGLGKRRLQCRQSPDVRQIDVKGSDPDNAR